MINTQGRTSAKCQTVYSELKPGTVHYEAKVHYDRSASLISNPAYF